MKVLKKAAGIILAVCLMVPMFGTAVFAADGVLMFSDPSTKVGENVSIDLVIQSSGGESVGDVNVTMSYDPAALEFVSGEGFSADGTGVLTYTGTGTGAELRATMQFRALLAGSTSVSVTGSSATVSTGDTLNLEQGASAVTIEAADDGSTSAEPSATAATPTGETTDITVSVDGTDYSFSEAFTTTDIPEGYSETTLAFNGADRKFVANEAGVTLGFLVDGSGKGSFFLFDTEDATFLPFAQLTISDTTSIIPLNEPDSVKLPDNYKESELTVQDKQFPVWSDPEESDRYYIIYALNTRTNQEGLYQYDKEDGTYQYFDASSKTDSGSEETSLPGGLGFISDHLVPVLVAGVLICILLLILMIVFAVKLIHRNQELDDLYDEYDIPLDDDDEKDDKGKKKNNKNEEPSDENYDDEYDDDYDDDDYDYDDDDEIDDDIDDDEETSDKDYNIDFVDL